MTKGTKKSIIRVFQNIGSNPKAPRLDVKPLELRFHTAFWINRQYNKQVAK